MLDRECPSHQHWGSFADNPAAGGVVTSISTDMAVRFSSMIATVFSAGRCLGLGCTGTGLAVQVINLHLNQALSFEMKCTLLATIADAGAIFEGVTFLLGDFNFVPSDEGRIHLSDGLDHFSDSRLAFQFEEMFSEYTECHQANYTSKQVTADHIISLRC